MSTKLVFNSELPKPMIVHGDIHTLLIACGYEVVEQEPFKLTYEKHQADGFHKRLVFEISDVTYSRYWPILEDDRAAHYAIMFTCNIRYATKCEDVAMLLHTIQAIDLTCVPEFRQMMREIITSTITHPQTAVA